MTVDFESLFDLNIGFENWELVPKNSELIFAFALRHPITEAICSFIIWLVQVIRVKYFVIQLSNWLFGYS